MSKPRKKALVIGTNYAGSDFALRGCLNDADDWAGLLGTHGYDVATLVGRRAGRTPVLVGLGKLIADLRPGDSGFVTFSGHGTWLPDVDGDEPDGRDECLVPDDAGEDGANLIVDDELGLLFSRLAVGAHLVFVTDCCHSGTVFRVVPRPHAYRRVRFLPPANFVAHPTLYSRVERAFGRPAPQADTPAPGVVHLSACRDAEYAADAEFDGRANGAFTHFATMALAAAHAAGRTYLDAWREVRLHLPDVEFPQTPLLNGLAADKHRKVFS